VLLSIRIFGAKVVFRVSINDFFASPSERTKNTSDINTTETHPGQIARAREREREEIANDSEREREK